MVRAKELKPFLDSPSWETTHLAISAIVRYQQDRPKSSSRADNRAGRLIDSLIASGLKRLPQPAHPEDLSFGYRVRAHHFGSISPKEEFATSKMRAYLAWMKHCLEEAATRERAVACDPADLELQKNRRSERAMACARTVLALQERRSIPPAQARQSMRLVCRCGGLEPGQLRGCAENYIQGRLADAHAKSLSR